jgi:hypothetical protein
MKEIVAVGMRIEITINVNRLACPGSFKSANNVGHRRQLYAVWNGCTAGAFENNVRK